MFKSKRSKIITVTAVFLLFVIVVVASTFESNVFVMLDGVMLETTHPITHEVNSIMKSDLDSESKQTAISRLICGTDYVFITVSWPRYLWPEKVAVFFNGIVQ